MVKYSNLWAMEEEGGKALKLLGIDIFSSCLDTRI